MSNQYQKDFFWIGSHSIACLTKRPLLNVYCGFKTSISMSMHGLYVNEKAIPELVIWLTAPMSCQIEEEAEKAGQQSHKRGLIDLKTEEQWFRRSERRKRREQSRPRFGPVVFAEKKQTNKPSGMCFFGQTCWPSHDVVSAGSWLGFEQWSPIAVTTRRTMSMKMWTPASRLTQATLSFRLFFF